MNYVSECIPGTKYSEYMLEDPVLVLDCVIGSLVTIWITTIFVFPSVTRVHWTVSYQITVPFARISQSHRGRSDLAIHLKSHCVFWHHDDELGYMGLIPRDPALVREVLVPKVHLGYHNLLVSRRFTLIREAR